MKHTPVSLRSWDDDKQHHQNDVGHVRGIAVRTAVPSLFHNSNSDRDAMKQLSLTWRVIASGHGPGPRSRHGLVYDRQSRMIVLFGGIDWEQNTLLSDTWEFRRGKWKKIEVPNEPPPRHRGAMVYDSVRGYAVLFGGQTRGVGTWPFLDDTWLYQDNCWTRQTGWFWKSPPARCGHSMAFDEDSGQTVMFGGVGSHDEPLGDTWIFDGRWRQLKCDGPPARRYAAFAYHPGLKGCVLHGGSVDDNGNEQFGDAWLFREQRWSPLGHIYGTDSRDDHGLAFHEALGKMVMLEGLLRDEDGRIKREVLVMTKVGWREIDVDPIHPRHQCSPLVYDSSLGGLVLHGGEAGHGGSQFDKTLLLRVDE